MVSRSEKCQSFFKAGSTTLAYCFLMVILTSKVKRSRQECNLLEVRSYTD